MGASLECRACNLAERATLPPVCCRPGREVATAGGGQQRHAAAALPGKCRGAFSGETPVCSSSIATLSRMACLMCVSACLSRHYTLAGAHKGAAVPAAALPVAHPAARAPSRAAGRPQGWVASGVCNLWAQQAVLDAAVPSGSPTLYPPAVRSGRGSGAAAAAAAAGPCCAAGAAVWTGRCASRGAAGGEARAAALEREQNGGGREGECHAPDELCHGFVCTKCTSKSGMPACSKCSSSALGIACM